jgi:hypothetical protein
MFWAVIMVVRIFGPGEAFELISSGKVNIVTYFKSTVFRKGVVSPKPNYTALGLLTAENQECVNFVFDRDCFNENPYI